MIKNIAIIVPQLFGGGAERIAGLLSKELAKKYNVYLFLLDQGNIVYEFGGTIVDVGRSGPLYEYDIQKYKRKFHIDCAISFMEPMNFANIRTRGPELVVISERSVQSFISPRNSAEALKIQRYYEYADAIVACSEGVKYDLRKNYHIQGNISTIYNFIDKNLIRARSQEELPPEIQNLLNGSEFFVNVGRLDPQKNQKRLILQFSYFHANHPDMKLLILGSGRLEQELSAYIRELGLEESVKIIPYNTNPFMYVARAKALILSSRFEGLPNTLLEAMTIGCPVIATDCLAGPRELLMDEVDYEARLDPLAIGKRGVIVSDGRAEDDGTTRYMAQAMELLWADEVLAETFRRNGQAYMEEYTNRKILDEWLRIIETCEAKSAEDALAKEEKMLSQAKYRVIYGAGYVGRTVLLRLSNRLKIDCFVVSHRQNEETECLGVPVRSISELRYPPDETAVIVGVGDPHQDGIVDTLEKYGFRNIVFPHVEPFSGEYYFDRGRLDIKKELEDWYKVHTGTEVHWEAPKSYNEKIQWLKLFDNRPIKMQLSDKYSVREYVSEKVGPQYLIPLLGVWDTFDAVDFSSLPDKFALKCTHGSSTNLIVRDKSKMNYDEAKRRFDQWIAMDYAYMSGFEMQYAGIPRRILAEKLLETPDGEDLRDYKVFVFNGKAKLIQVDIDREHGHKRNLYTPAWEYVPYSIKYPTAPETVVERPACLDEMIRLAEVLAEGFIHVRVDFYIWNGRIFFGEMTFTHGSGVEPFEPEEFGLEMGSWIELPKGEK